MSDHWVAVHRLHRQLPSLGNLSLLEHSAQSTATEWMEKYKNQDKLIVNCYVINCSGKTEILFERLSSVENVDDHNEVTHIDRTQLCAMTYFQ